MEIGLTEAIGALREELTAAIAAAGAERLKFEVGQITMEFQVVVERAVKGKGGVKFWVVEAGAEASTSTARTHRLTVPLTPVSPQGTPVLTGEVIIPE